MKARTTGSRAEANKKFIWAAAIGLTLLIIWASLAKVDEVTRGMGKVIPSSKVQLIQPAEPATIREILVRAGQTVEQGQLLVRLDDTDSSSALGQLEAENRRLAERADRLAREASGSGSGCVGAGCADEARLQAVRQSALRSRESALAATIEQRRRDLQEAQATAASLESSVKLASDQVNMLTPLAQKNIVPQTELLDAQRELVDVRGRLSAARQAVGHASAGIQEAQAQLSSARLEARSDALRERSDVTTKIEVNRESIRGAAGRQQKAEIRSPVNGVVNDVQITTVGGFVNAGEKIMQIVPMGDRLLVETRVAPSDIAFLKVGDPAIVKVTAYDFSIYGGLNGKIAQISPDSIYDEVERKAYFTVIVETNRAYIEKNAQKLPITPGMICDVEIITGRKSVLSYLLKPVYKATGEALRER